MKRACASCSRDQRRWLACVAGAGYAIAFVVEVENTPPWVVDRHCDQLTAGPGWQAQQRW